LVQIIILAIAILIKSAKLALIQTLSLNIYRKSFAAQTQVSQGFNYISLAFYTQQTLHLKVGK